jgi:hypothetical protein
VPVIAIFFGIVIRMHYREHEPRHFRAEHQAHEGKFDFEGNQIVGNITSASAGPHPAVGAAQSDGTGREVV